MNLFWFASPAIKLLLDRLAVVKVVNPPRFDEGRGYVLSSNHIGWAECVWVPYAVYPRRVAIMAKREIFKGRLVEGFLRQAGALPIDRDRPKPASIKEAIERLRAGELLLVFPSGTRSGDESNLKRGVATISLHARAPIYPVVFDGPTKIAWAHFLKRPVVTVTFGEPLYPDESPSRAATMALLARIESEAASLKLRIAQASAAAG